MSNDLPGHNEYSSEAYARVMRLLERDEHALVAAMPVIGTLNLNGWMVWEIDQAMDRAKALGLDFYELLVDRLQEARQDVQEASGEDLGVALTLAQGLVVLALEVKSHVPHKDHKISWGLFLKLNQATFSLLLEATARAALANAPGPAQDLEAQGYVDTWARHYQVDKGHFLVFLR